MKVFPSRPSPKTNWPEQEVSVETGYVMVGGGAYADWTGDGSMLFASYPMDKTTWRAQSKDHIKADPAKISAYAIGLKCKVAGVKVLSEIAIGKSNKSNRPQATIAPPGGYKMVGGGSKITFDKDGVMLYASFPTESNQWEGRGKDHLVADSARVDVYCIGVKVVDA
ncbi:MAG: hypothetical protein WBD78_14610 [Methylocella sp.]